MIVGRICTPLMTGRSFLTAWKYNHGSFILGGIANSIYDNLNCLILTDLIRSVLRKAHLETYAAEGAYMRFMTTIHMKTPYG